MNAAAEPEQPDTLDRIANALPIEVRADYYREMRHLRSLPENDEMLRILRAMQFLSVLIFDAPTRTAAENEKLKEILNDAFESLEDILQAVKKQQAQLDQRLTQLPQTVVAGIQPQVIVAGINESLRQEFLKSTIPGIASALSVTSGQMKNSNTELIQTARELSEIHRGLVAETRPVIASLKAESSELRKEAANSKRVFDRGKRVLFSLILALGLATGVSLEYWLQHSFFPPTPQIVCAPALPTPPATPPTRPRSKH